MVSNETDFAITKEQLDFSNSSGRLSTPMNYLSFPNIEKTRLMASPEGQPASRVQYPLQEPRRQSLFTIPEHDALEQYNDESTAQLSKGSASLFYAGKKRFLSDSSVTVTKRQKVGDSVDNLNDKHRCNSDL
ncbi:Adenine DNA glycosylase [Fusarium oxysporum f. sp. albedinis]|nr:Adenine DNA glycosylase [Fusarium oxysporum f. sp. albedinis]